MTKDEAMKIASEALDAITYGIERDLEHDHELAVVERELASEAIIALRERLAKPEQELVVLNQFLSDVMTAADLVRHGKQCKALATRLRVEVMKLHTALRQALEQPEQEPDPFDRLIRIMGTFDLSTGHADNWTDLLDSLESELRDVLGYYRETFKAERKCNPHPDAPHGFDRDASHNLDRYVCECEGWEPEPVAYVTGTSSGYFVVKPTDPSLVLPEKMALYSTPPKREWVGLTDEEILEAAGIDGADTWVFETAYAIEAKLKDKNT